MLLPEEPRGCLYKIYRFVQGFHCNAEVPHDSQQALLLIELTSVGQVNEKR